ncbi:glycoside hydrolase family protein [Lacunimicrobium album]
MRFLLTAAFVLMSSIASAQEPAWIKTGEFQWTCSPPYISARTDGKDPDVALKDPTIVFHDGYWHFFGTHRMQSGKVAMQYLKFKDWSEADKVERHTLSFMEHYHCAPQVFYHTPHQKWYLIYQAAKDWHKTGATLPEDFDLVPVYSTTTDIADPQSWTAPQEMFPEGRTPKTHWIDFWVICDDDKAHLFYTSDDGHFWRRETAKDNFPVEWGPEELVLKDTKEELFEASHTYKLKGRDEYLTIIEAMGPGFRYYKAWLADKLEGPWRPLAATRDKPFADTHINVTQPDPAWTTSISHGELIRSRNDETLEIDPADLKFVIQGATTEGYKKKYSHIPWKIGVLELTK